MTYVSPNYKTKKELKEAVERGNRVIIFEPISGLVPNDGVVSVSGPHAPLPHTWDARVSVKDGYVVKVVK